MRVAIEGIGATLVLDSDIYPAMMEGNELDRIGFGVTESLKKKFGLEDVGERAWRYAPSSACFNMDSQRASLGRKLLIRI